jgi:hypothetical protein
MRQLLGYGRELSNTMSTPKKWISVAPIENSRWHTAVSLPIEFEKGVRIDRMPVWAYSTDTMVRLALADSERIKRSRNAFLVEYEAEALGSPDPEDRSDKPRGIQTTMHEAIFLANLALWIASPNAVGFCAMIHFDEADKEPQVRQYSSLREFLPHLDYENRILATEDFRLAQTLHKQLLLLDREGTVWRAAYSIWLGLREPDWASRFMQMWITMEALFGPEDAREITFRISQRIALFLSSEKSEASELFKDVKSSYSWRSKVAHGLRLSKLHRDESEVLSYSIEQLAATSMAKILSDTNLTKMFEGLQREEFLDNLVFTA